MIHIANRYMAGREISRRALQDTPVSSRRIDEILTRVMARRS